MLVFHSLSFLTLGILTLHFNPYHGKTVQQSFKKEGVQDIGSLYGNGIEGQCNICAVGHTVALTAYTKCQTFFLNVRPSPFLLKVILTTVWASIGISQGWCFFYLTHPETWDRSGTLSLCHSHLSSRFVTGNPKSVPDLVATMEDAKMRDMQEQIKNLQQSLEDCSKNTGNFQYQFEFPTCHFYHCLGIIKDGVACTKFPKNILSVSVAGW